MGRPPHKIREFDVLEKAPSHDDTPCFTVWKDHEVVEVGWAWHEDEPLPRGRPELSLQIYDTNPASKDPTHVRTLAQHLQDSTWDRVDWGREFPDRLDVYGLALPEGTTRDEKVSRCLRHSKSEIVSRNETGDSSFYIARADYFHWTSRALVIIDSIHAQTNEAEAEVIVVRWDMPTGMCQSMEIPLGGPNIDVRTYQFGKLTEVLGEMRYGAQSFYESWIEDGSMAREIEEAASAKQRKASSL